MREMGACSHDERADSKTVRHFGVRGCTVVLLLKHQPLNQSIEKSGVTSRDHPSIGSCSSVELAIVYARLRSIKLYLLRKYTFSFLSFLEQHLSGDSLDGTSIVILAKPWCEVWVA